DPRDIDLAWQRHRLGIFFLLDPPHCLLEGADIAATLVFGVGNIWFAGRGGRLSCDRSREQRADHRYENAVFAVHHTGSGASRRDASASAASAPRGSSQTASPMATKSAPAADSGVISVRLAANPTQGTVNSSAHHSIRSTMASNGGRR